MPLKAPFFEEEHPKPHYKSLKTKRSNRPKTTYVSTRFVDRDDLVTIIGEPQNQIPYLLGRRTIKQTLTIESLLKRKGVRKVVPLDRQGASELIQELLALPNAKKRSP